MPPTKDVDFDVRFEDISLTFTKKEYPFYSLKLKEKSLRHNLSLTLFYGEAQLDIPQQSLHALENMHLKVQIDTCNIKDCLQIISYDSFQYQSLDCTLKNFPPLKIEIFKPAIYAEEERKELEELINNDSIPISARLRLRKILGSTFSSLESYYNSLKNKQ